MNSTFVFTIESETDREIINIECKDEKWKALDAGNRLTMAVKALRQHRSFKEWRIVHVYEKGLPGLGDS